MKLHFIILFCVVGCLQTLKAQIVPYSILYNDTVVNSIYITMDADSLNELYYQLENVHEYAVEFVYKNGLAFDTLQNVGIRLRGNTSLESAKKSFKISFNTYAPGREFEGAKKLNLIGNHNDPTMSREKIYFDIYNNWGLPPRRVSFARFYINGSYYGLYTLTEEVDDIFLQNRFGESAGNLYKCLYSSDFVYRGTNQGSYNSYELLNNEQQNDKSDLIHLTDILNNTPIENLECELEKVFNVDGFLKIYALDISTGHWDNYGANQNNFYLYHNTKTGKIEFLSYDADNTMGVDFFGIDWTDRNIYAWNFEGRPMVERLMQIERYRDLFSYYLNALNTTLIVPENIFPHIDSIRELIAPAAFDDMYRTYDYGYTYDDFYNGFTTNAIDGHTPYGIENFITRRVNYTSLQLEINNITPIIKNEKSIPDLPQPGDDVTIQVYIKDDLAIADAKLYYSDDNIAFTSTNVFDDGAHNDMLPYDGIYGTIITTMPGQSELYYYFEATDNTSNTSRLPVCETFNLHVGYTIPTLVINEFMAVNDATIADNFGGFSDYIELYNPGPIGIFLKGKYLSDDFNNPGKWELPDQLLLSNAYLIIWADNDTEQGNAHCNFKLNGSGDEIGIFSGIEYAFSVIDTISFNNQSADISTGRLPNGSGNFVILPEPTPGANNETAIVIDSAQQFQFTILGNPSFGNGLMQLDLLEPASITIDLFSINGDLILEIENNILTEGSYNYTMKTAFLSSGIYILRLNKNGDNFYYKFLEL